MKHRVIETAALLSTALIFAVATAPAGAASACKGLEKKQCEATADCTWVDGYTRKDKVKVSAHCKSKPKKKSSASSKDKK